MTVSPEDRAKWERQVEGLKQMENDDEGTPEWRAKVTEDINRWRQEHGIPPLKKWWETKTEPEFHKRARALGLLD